MTKDLTRGTPWKLILQFALPIMAGNLLQQLYNTADTIIVGNFNGQQALSAVGACASLTVLFTALAIGFSIGAGVLISQYFGASRERELRQYAATAIVLMLALGLRVVFAYALHKTSLFGYTAIWWSQAMSWTITLVVCYVHFFRGKWKDKSLIS